MAAATANLVLLPGLGADARLFGPQSRAFPGLRVPAWPEPVRGESLAGFAARMALEFEPPPGPYVLGGASMGGMVALEMARRLRPRALVLIGSALSGHEVRGWLRLVECAAHPLPSAAIELGRWLAPLGAPLFSSTGPQHRELFLDMLNATPVRFIRWAAEAVVQWRAGELPDVPLHRIHGGSDRIITPPRGGGVVIVPGAGHLVNLSHAREVNRFIERAMADADGPERS